MLHLRPVHSCCCCCPMYASKTFRSAEPFVLGPSSVGIRLRKEASKIPHWHFRDHGNLGLRCEFVEGTWEVEVSPAVGWLLLDHTERRGATGATWQSKAG
ncbi:hypothetical protein BD309DRAFT_973298 [Dichomitus squalens]|nr:hypothetical protein BD309DRAFT_973298 [Dichomitus squalens]